MPTLPLVPSSDPFLPKSPLGLLHCPCLPYSLLFKINILVLIFQNSLLIPLTSPATVLFLFCHKSLQSVFYSYCLQITPPILLISRKLPSPTSSQNLPGSRTTKISTLLNLTVIPHLIGQFSTFDTINHCFLLKTCFPADI